MFQNLRLTRPLAVLDCETHCGDVATARVIEVSVCRVEPDGHAAWFTQRCNPGLPIAESAAKVHGISDGDVALAPTFKAIAPDLADFLSSADLAGYNLKIFDLRILCREFHEAGVPFSMEGRAVVDACQIFKAMEPRDLAAAVRLFCGREHVGAHGARADVQASAEVLDGLLARYVNLPRTVTDLHDLYRDRDAVDLDGKFKRRADGAILFTFGKHQGKPLAEVIKTDRSYIDWLLSGTFMPDTKAVVREAMKRC